MASTHQLRAQDLFSVKGYVCVVTGGGTGIGLMATQTLAANGKSSFHWPKIRQKARTEYSANRPTTTGAKVYITGRRMEVLENAAKTHSPENGGEIIP